MENGESALAVLRDLADDVDPVSHKNHFKYPYYCLTPFMPVFFIAPPLILYFLNPCVNYVPVTLLWGVGGIYVILSSLILTAFMISDKGLWFCTAMQCKLHLLWEILLYASFGSSIAYYQMYAYFSGIASVFAGSAVLVMLFATAFWYNCCFNLAHIRACPQKYLPHLEVYQGSGCLRVFSKIIEALILIGILVLLAFMFVYNGQFLNSTRPAYNVCQVPLTALNP